MRWLYWLRLLWNLPHLSRISPKPLSLLGEAMREPIRYPLHLREGQNRFCEISLPNLYGLLQLRQIGLMPAPHQPDDPTWLRWQLSPQGTFLTRLSPGMDLMHLYELFVRKDYGEDFSDRVVLDIGAYNGDSAVYFALKGAKRIIALEPYPPSYQLAQQNIHSMGLADRITLLPVGLGVQVGKATMRVATQQPGANTVYGIGSALQKMLTFEREVEIELLPFSALLEKFGLEEVDFVKLDCEGCEFAVIQALSLEELRRAKVWHIEYHASPTPLIQKLKSAGYEVKKQRDRGILGYLVAQQR
ncbi:MAG: FkbM family methyltransferase [Bacteroidia bacterium]|nr:FkbM family methyltransferase [Bacteroidia bacterium]MDW8236220.1 FkbM family methyltransferase [Bacteroidia bacterium]